ncbi:MAG: PEP-utilizing enzyme [Parcubacteria group bacterium]
MSQQLRQEDETRDQRLALLHQEIGFPFLEPDIFPAAEMMEKSPRFVKFLRQNGDRLCAMRLIPQDKSLPKLRNRGLSVQECYDTWFKKLKIDPSQYTVYIPPHSNKTSWSAIFVVSAGGVFGDILVCQNTDVRFLPLMKKAGAIVTDQGGLLSHAAIVARELKKPCLVGTKSATKDLQTGDMIRVGAQQGIVVKLNRS